MRHLQLFARHRLLPLLVTPDHPAPASLLPRVCCQKPCPSPRCCRTASETCAPRGEDIGADAPCLVCSDPRAYALWGTRLARVTPSSLPLAPWQPTYDASPGHRQKGRPSMTCTGLLHHPPEQAGQGLSWSSLQPQARAQDQTGQLLYEWRTTGRGKAGSGKPCHGTAKRPDLGTRGPRRVPALSSGSSGTLGKSLQQSTWAYFVTCMMR